MPTGRSPQDINRMSSFLGLMTQSDNASVEITPPEGDLETARKFGAYLVGLKLKIFTSIWSGYLARITGIIQPNVKYKIITEDGKTISGITDAEGKTEKISSLSMVKAELTILGRKDD